MAHTLRTTVALPIPPADAAAAFRSDPGRWLPEPGRRNGIGHWLVHLWAGQLGVLVDCALAEVLRDGPQSRRRMTWQPLRDEESLLTRAVPSFRGELCLLDRGDGVAELVVDGTYRPPGGVAGSLADRLALHVLAKRTATTFLRAVADGLDRLARTSTA